MSSAPSILDRDRLVLPDRLASRPWRRHWRWLAGILVFLTTMLSAWVSFRRSPALRYRAEPLSRRTITRQVEAPGQLDAPHHIEVAAPYAGRLVRVLVQAGQVVEEGQELAQLEAVTAAQALEAARRSLAVARAHLAEAAANVEGAWPGKIWRTRASASIW